jgi:hypothetical protein
MTYLPMGMKNVFGAKGIDAALWSGSVTYFFKGNEYIRVTRTSDTDFGTTDPGYPRSIYAGWGWNNDFNNGVRVHYLVAHDAIFSVVINICELAVDSN